MLIERINFYLEKLSNDEQQKQNETSESTTASVIRLSRSGECARKLAYSLVPSKYKPKRQSTRRLLVLQEGSNVDTMLKTLLKKADPYFSNADLEVHLTVDVDGEKYTIPGHLDGMSYDPEIGFFVVEIKSASNETYASAVKGLIDYTYACQAIAYSHATGIKNIAFLFYRKETAHLLEVLFVQENQEVSTAVVLMNEQRIEIDRNNLSENLIKDSNALAIKVRLDPSLIDDVINRWQKVIRFMKNNYSEEYLPDREYQFSDTCPKCDGTGNLQKGKCTLCDGTGKTKFVVLGYPCTYCPFIDYCYPQTHVEYISSRLSTQPKVITNADGISLEEAVADFQAKTSMWGNKSYIKAVYSMHHGKPVQTKVNLIDEETTEEDQGVIEKDQEPV